MTDYEAKAREVVVEWLAQEPEAQTFTDLAERACRAAADEARREERERMTVIIDGLEGLLWGLRDHAMNAEGVAKIENALVQLRFDMDETEAPMPTDYEAKAREVFRDVMGYISTCVTTHEDRRKVDLITTALRASADEVWDEVAALCDAVDELVAEFPFSGDMKCLALHVSAVRKTLSAREKGGPDAD